VHVEIASRINKAIEERALVALGKLEQDLVFGDATSKEVIAFLAGHGATPAQEKARGALSPPRRSDTEARTDHTLLLLTHCLRQLRAAARRRRSVRLRQWVTRNGVWSLRASRVGLIESERGRCEP
jgi:hypothetical protein